MLVSPTPVAEEVLAGAPPLLQEHFTRFRRLPDWQQTQILSSLQRIVALMEAADVEAGPILTTGPLDATPEKTEAFLETAPARGRRRCGAIADRTAIAALSGSLSSYANI